MADMVTDRGFEPNALRRYELLSENTRDIVLFLRPNGQIIEANRAAVLSYGYSRQELLAMNVSDLRVDEERSTVPEHIARARSEGITLETVHRRKDGSTFPVEVSSSPSELGGVLLSIVRDITQRKQVEATRELLREADNRILRRERLNVILQFICEGLAATFNLVNVFIATKNPDGSVSVATQAGVSSDMLRHMQVRWDDTPLGMGSTGRAIATGQLQTITTDDENVQPWRDVLSKYGVRLSISIPLIAQGQTLGALTMYAPDDRILDNESLPFLTRFADEVAISLLAARDQEQIHLQSAALAAAANAIMLVGRDGRILWVNPAWTAMTGYEPSEAVGKSLSLLGSAQHDAGFYRDLFAAAFSGETWRGEMVSRRKDGSLYTEEIAITPVLGCKGEITHFVAVEQDITERKQQEKRLRYLTRRRRRQGLGTRRR